ncbi:hypothetical protein [Sphaerospermopsis sp. FACHB-1194]|nr:hypothetical protein [Sphaerospermopsis sp. FACHB-1194]MBD2145161.1 hypothetical protein [Sphaerospermopsis sp. FACHB-1194]
MSLPIKAASEKKEIKESEGRRQEAGGRRQEVKVEAEPLGGIPSQRLGTR